MSQYLSCEHISVSRKQTWDSCQAKYRFRYHLKIMPTVIQPYFVYGKLVHKIAEVYTQEQGKVQIGEIATNCLNGTIKVEENQLAPPVLEPDYFKKLPKHLKSIKDLTDRIGYDGHLEWSFKHDLQPPDGHIVVGFIDRLIIRGDKYFILDYKTTKKGFWRKNQNTIRKDLQLRSYARIVQKEFGAKPENIRCALYYLDGGPGNSGDLISTRFSEESLISAEKELHDAYKDITSTNPDDVYGRVNDQCKRCDYKSVCSHYSLL